MRVLRFFAVLGLGLTLAAVAHAKTTVAFYSHGWGVATLFVYFPHAFVVITRDGGDAPAARQTSYGFTAVSQGPDALTGPTPGEVAPAYPEYVKRSVLHLTVEITDAEYQALLQRVAAWSGPNAPPYDLKRHNCVGFVADLANAIDLKTPSAIGSDPARYLEQLARLNSERNLETAAPPAASPSP